MKKSPIVNEVHHNPGQSLQRKIIKEVLNSLGILIIVLLLDVAYLGWIFGEYIPPSKTHTWIPLVVILVLLPIVFLVISKNNRKIDLLVQGRDGEQGMGLYLNRLWSETCFVFHDIQGTWKNGNHFNIDHILVSTKGVFVVETKTFSKDDSTENIIKHRGDQLWINGVLDKFNALEEPRRHSIWLNNYLNDHKIQGAVVIPVLLFPRWKVDSLWNRNAPENLVFSGKAFNTEFIHFPECISRAEFEKIKLAVCELARNSADV